MARLDTFPAASREGPGAHHGRPGGATSARSPTPARSQDKHSQGAAADVERIAQATGRELSAAGVNVNLAPVADVARPGSIMSPRAFPGDAASVAEATEASVG